MTKEITCLLCDEKPVFDAVYLAIEHFSKMHPSLTEANDVGGHRLLAKRTEISHSDGEDFYEYEFAWKTKDGVKVAIETDTHPRRRARYG